MPRRPRIDYPGAWHHVMHRAAGDLVAFRDDDECIEFLALVESSIDLYELEIHAYALLPGHYHLLIRSQAGRLSDAMRYINGMYTRRANAGRGRDGPLFRGRFRSQLIEDEDYLVTALAYIHLNPVRKGLVKRPDDECWTSHRAYLGRDKGSPWLQCDHLLELVGGPEILDQLLRDLIQHGQPWPPDLQLDGEEGVDLLFPKISLPPGNSPGAGPPQPSSRMLDPNEVLHRVCAIANVPRQQLRDGQKGRGGNPPRRFAVWALDRYTTLSQREIGELVGCRTNHISQMVWRMRRSTTGKVAAWIELWEAD
jgi:REP element-mobilizing transposase RayT